MFERANCFSTEASKLPVAGAVERFEHAATACGRILKPDRGQDAAGISIVDDQALHHTVQAGTGAAAQLPMFAAIGGSKDVAVRSAEVSGSLIVSSKRDDFAAGRSETLPGLSFTSSRAKTKEDEECTECRAQITTERKTLRRK